MEGYEGKVAFRNRRKCIPNPDYETVANGGKAVYKEVIVSASTGDERITGRRYATLDDSEKGRQIPDHIYV